MNIKLDGCELISAVYKFNKIWFVSRFVLYDVNNLFYNYDI